MAQYAKFAPWLDSDDPDLVANAMLILINRTLNMLGRQLKAQGENFRETGGFRERMTTVRLEERDKKQAAPVCPECGQPMRKRTARSGKNAGKPFWGCIAFPECKGVRDVVS